MKDEALERFAAQGLRFPFSPLEEGYFTSQDCRIFYATFGHGSPVVLLHGGMGNTTNWAHQVGCLVEEGYRAVVMDTRGHGRSTAGEAPFSYGLFARDLAGLLDHLALEEVTLVGWSDGACTALEFARTRPHRVRGVVFFACNVDPTGTLEFRMTDTIGNCLTRHRRDFDAMTPSLAPFDSLQPRLDPMQKNEPNYDVGQLGQIGVPVTVVQGDRDEFIALAHAQYLAASLGNGRLEVLADLGHFAPIQDPDAFNAVLLDSLDRFGRPGVLPVCHPAAFNFRPVRLGAPGLLFRSGSPERTTIELFRHQIAASRISTIVDLRNEDERAPSLALYSDLGAVRVLSVPFLETVKDEWVSPQAKDPGSTAGRYLAMIEQSRRATQQVFRILCDRPGPVLIHCAAGRDRTGMVYALLLGALGVPVEAIARDYARSHGAVTDGYGASAETMVILFRNIEARYGGIEGLLNTLGVSEGLLGAFRARYQTLAPERTPWGPFLGYFDAQFDGNAINGPALMTTLSGLTADQAASTATFEGYSVWAVVLHLCWCKWFLLKELVGPTEPYPYPSGVEGLCDPTDASAEAWDRVLDYARGVHRRLVTALRDLGPVPPSRTIEPWGLTVAGAIAWIVGHDTYHLAQIRSMGVPGLAARRVY